MAAGPMLGGGIPGGMPLTAAAFGAAPPMPPPLGGGGGSGGGRANNPGAKGAGGVRQDFCQHFVSTSAMLGSGQRPQNFLASERRGRRGGGQGW